MNMLRDFEHKIFERINPAVRFSVTRYVLAVGIFVGVAVFGLISTANLGVDLLPAVNVPTVVINTSYPGATPGVVDQQVTQVIENVVSTMSGITDMNSTSSIGFSQVILGFDPGVDKNSAMNQTAALVAASVRRLPPGINPPTVRTFDPNSQPILQFGLSGEGAGLEDVSDYAQNTLAPTLTRINGVANVLLEGAPTRVYQVLLNPDRLLYYGLTPQQVVNAITGAAVNQPIGTIVSAGSALTFATQNIPTNLEQIGRTLVDSARGITVGDLGAVRAGSAVSDFARVNQKPQVLVSIQRTIDSNSVQVVKDVRDALAQTNLPAGFVLIYSNDTTGPINASIQSTFRELVTTGLVVAFIVLLFLGKLSTAFSVILAIPVALSAAPVLYKLSGFTFNLVSLLALIIAIGIVVDDSIVVAENVERYRKMGLALKDAVLKGASEVFSAVVAASLSLISVLIPVSFIGGFIGRYLQQFSLGLAAAVGFSLLEAVLFLTVRLAYTPEARQYGWKDAGESLLGLRASLAWGIKNWRTPAGLAGAGLLAAGIAWSGRYALFIGLAAYPFILGACRYLGRLLLSFTQALVASLHGFTEKGLTAVREAYAGILPATMRRSAWILGGSLLLLAVSVAVIMPRIPFNFVPQSDSGTLSIFVRFPSGTPQAIVNETAGRLERYLLERKEVETVQTNVGNNARLTVQLAPIEERSSIFSLIPEYRRELLVLLRNQPSINLSVSAGGGFQGQGSALQFNIVAPNFNALVSRNASIVQTIQSDPFVTDVFSSLSATTLQSDFSPDAARLKGTGISPAALAQTLQTYTSGTQAGTVLIGGLSYPIQVQLNPTSLSGGQSLLDLPVYAPALQTTLKVGQLGGFSLSQAPVSISRYNRQYAGQLTVNLRPDAPPALAMQDRLSEELSSRGLLGDGVSLTVNSRFGQVALAGQLASQGPTIFLLALFLSYLVMAAQFNSWRFPIYLFLPVPLALIGALWLVFLIGGGLDIFGLMGMIMLIGLSAKNAIIYLDFVVERMGHMPFADALIEAARLRFRPIIMTTMTVLVISFPLILGHGQGAEFGKRMGVVMLGGILSSAVLTFFVVPAAFYHFERKRAERMEAASKSERRASTEA